MKLKDTLAMAARKACMIICLCVFMAVLLVQWKVIIFSLESLALTLYELLIDRTDAVSSLRFGVVEYWLATTCWLSGSMFFGKQCFHMLRRKGFRSERNISLDRKLFLPQRMTSSLILLLFIIALSAPLLAPCDPMAQADLRTTRLLRPLAVVAMKEDSDISSLHFVKSFSPVGRKLDEINTFLIYRPDRQFHRTSVFDEEKQGYRHAQTFFMGTDDLGRDVLSRLLYALRISFAIGLLAMVGTIVIGCIIGLVAGMAKGWVDHLLMRVTDLFLAIPSLFLIIVLVAFFGNSAGLLVVVLAATGWMSVARIVRGEVLSLREREFILAAQLLGRTQVQIVRDHIIPHVTSLITVAAVLQLSNVILAEAALSFLGLGIQPPTPSLGNMMGESLSYIDSAWWVGVFPGIVLSMSVISINMLAESLQKESLIG